MKLKQETQTELSEIVYNWLTRSGNKINSDYCKQEITSHSDYPAITSVVDFLDAGNMSYQAVQTDASYIHQFNYPLLAHIKKTGNEYLHFIPNIDAWELEKETTQHWSGITIFPEKNTYWKNEENNEAIRNTQKQKFLFGAWCGIGFLMFTTSVIFRSEVLYNLFGFFSVIGVFISATAFATELGIQSNTVKQVCGAVSKGGCEAVLKSKLAKGIFRITAGDAAVLYFTGQFIVYLIAIFFEPAFSALPYMSLLGIAIAGISIYSQAVVIKQWCALCLAIASVLILQAIVGIFLLGIFSFYSLVILVTITFLLLPILFPIKTLLKDILAAKPKLVELKKWQSDANIFSAQLEKEQSVDITIWENDLVIGDINAPIMITVACNPYCYPCAKAHKKLDQILEKFKGKVKVQIRLLCSPTNENDKNYIAVKAILQQAALAKTNFVLQQMLSDWFEWMNYDKWTNKWNDNIDQEAKRLLYIKSDSAMTEYNVMSHANWVNSNNITHTPTFFINSKKLPGRYSLNEIEKLIPQLIGYYEEI